LSGKQKTALLVGSLSNQSPVVIVKKTEQQQMEGGPTARARAIWKCERFSNEKSFFTEWRDLGEYSYLTPTVHSIPLFFYSMHFCLILYTPDNELVNNVIEVSVTQVIIANI